MDTSSEPTWEAKAKPSWNEPVTLPTWVIEAQEKLRQPAADVVLWNPTTREVMQFHVMQAVDLLDQAKQHQTWQEEGLTVCANQLTNLLPDFGRPTQERGQKAPARVHLSPAQVAALLPLLQEHETTLRKRLETEAQATRKSFEQAQLFVFSRRRLLEVAHTDLMRRPYPWREQEEREQSRIPSRLPPVGKSWVCDAPPNRGTVRLVLNGLAWKGYLERPHKPVRESEFFGLFEEALTWVEEQLQAAAGKQEVVEPPKPELLTLATLTPEHRARLAPFWIEPSALEPAHLTYRAVIYLEHAPASCKYWEFSFGEKIPYDEKYPTVLQLVQTMHLEPHAVDVHQMAGKLYRITSLATFGDAAAAEGQAQRWWERSAIAESFRANKVVRAGYGVEEVETMYRRWLSWYGDWSSQIQDRAAFMAEKAFDLTLAHALDVEGHRAWLGITKDQESDEAVLRLLHEDRAKSPGIPTQAREESRRWLAEHK